MDDENLPGIRQISAGIRWIIELQIVIAVPMLMFSAIAIVASELSGGGLLSSDPNFVTLTSWTQAIGIEGAFFSNMIHARQNFAKGHSGRGTVMLLIGIVLCLITVLAMVAGNFESAFGLNTKEALFALGISTALWAWIRAIVYGIVSFADAYMFYVPVPKLTESQVKEQIKQAQLKAQLTQEKAVIRAANLKANLGGIKGVIKDTLGKKGEEKDVDIGDETTELSGENPPPNLTVLPVKTANNSAKKQWTWRDYQEFVLSKYHQDISENEAVSTVKTIGKNERDSSKPGQPFIASNSALKAHAKKMFGAENVEKKAQEG